MNARPIRVAALTTAMLASLLVVVPVRAIVTPFTGMYLDSAADDPMRAGASVVIGGGSGTLDATPGTPPPATESILWGYTVAGGGYGYVYMLAPSGHDLAVGSYPGAVDRVDRDATHPGLTFIYVGPGGGCWNASGGRFDISEVTYSGDTLVSFAGSFDTACTQEFHPNPGPIHGDIRWASTVPLTAAVGNPVSLAFATRNTDTVSAPQTITVDSVGTAPLTVSSVSIGGADPTQFHVDGQTCTGSPVASGASCTIDVSFRPTGSAGTRSATIVVNDDTVKGSRSFPVTGTATLPVVAVGLSPASLDFGDVPLPTTASALMATLTNTGTLPVDVTAVTVSGGASGDFAVAAETCVADPVPVGGSCTASVTFTPAALGTRSANLVFAHDGTTADEPLTGNGVPPGTAVTWGPLKIVRSSYTWNEGSSMARTAPTVTSEVLHVAYATNRVGSRWVTDRGPHLGVYYIRSKNHGTTWSVPVRLNPTTQHGERVGMAAAGKSVYAIWVSQTKAIKYKPSAPRVLWFRANSNHGSGAWRAPVRLTSLVGRVDFPTITAAGTRVFVTWTNSITGTIRVAVSNDRGRTWRQTTIGRTIRKPSGGFSGEPSIAASGESVIVSYQATAAGDLEARTSIDHAAHWLATISLGTGSTPSSAALGTRVAVAWVNGLDLFERGATSGTWGPIRTAAKVTAGPLGHDLSYSPALRLSGATGVGVAWAVHRAGSQWWSDLQWVESADDGALWRAPQVLASANSSPSRHANDWPSVVWPSPGTRYVLWNGWSPNTSSYRLYLKVGSGTP